MSRSFLWVLVFGVCASQWGNNFWDQTWYTKWLLLLILLIGWIGVWLAREIHWSVLPIFLSTAWNGMNQVGNPRYAYNNWALFDQFMMRADAAYTLIAFLILTMFFVSLRKRHYWELTRIFAWMCFANSLYILAESTGPVLGRSGFFGNGSMSGCLIAVTYPFWLSQLRLERKKVLPWFGALIPVVAIVATETSMPFGVLFVVLSCWFLKRYTINRTAIAGVLVSLLTLGFLGQALMGAEFLHTNGRRTMWILSTQWWLENSSILWGRGLGTSQFVLPYVQKISGILNVAEGVVTNAYYWLHNDWLQTLQEQGLVGLASLFILFTAVAWHARRSRMLLPAVLGFAAMALGNYPNHLPVHAFVGVALIMMSFRIGHEAR